MGKYTSSSHGSTKSKYESFHGEKLDLPPMSHPLLWQKSLVKPLGTRKWENSHPKGKRLLWLPYPPWKLTVLTWNTGVGRWVSFLGQKAYFFRCYVPVSFRECKNHQLGFHVKLQGCMGKRINYITISPISLQLWKDSVKWIRKPGGVGFFQTETPA